jgi:hypothetical protein
MAQAVGTTNAEVQPDEGHRQPVALVGLPDLIERPLDMLDSDELAKEANVIIDEVNALGMLFLDAGWPRVLYLGRIWIEAKARNSRAWKKWYDANIKGRSFRSAQDDMKLVRAVDEGKVDPKDAESAHLPVYKALRLLRKPATKRRAGQKRPGDHEVEAEFKAIKTAYENASTAGRERFHQWVCDHHGFCAIPREKMALVDGAT